MKLCGVETVFLKLQNLGGEGWKLEERITAPASRQAPCRQLHFPSFKTVFLRIGLFLCNQFSFRVNMAKKTLVKKLQTPKTTKEFCSCVLLHGCPLQFYCSADLLGLVSLIKTFKSVPWGIGLNMT